MGIVGSGQVSKSAQPVKITCFSALLGPSSGPTSALGHASDMPKIPNFHDFWPKSAEIADFLMISTRFIKFVAAFQNLLDLQN